MVIAGVTDYSPMRAGAASVVLERPSSASGARTKATGSPPLSVPPPGLVAAEKTPPLESARPLVVNGVEQSAPRVAPPAPPVAPAPPVLHVPAVPLAASAPAGEVAAHLAPVPGVPDAPAGAVPGVPALASASSSLAVSATTGGPPSVVALPSADQSPPVPPPAAPVVPPSRPPSPDRRLSRPHSPAPQQERETSRRRRNSPRCYQQQAQWPTHPGGSGGWRGPPGRGGGGWYRPPVTLADLQREVSREVSRAVPAEKTPPLESARPLVVNGVEPSAPRVAPPAPPVAPAPPVLHVPAVPLAASAPAGEVAAHPAPSLAVSATTGGPPSVVALPSADQSPPVPPPAAPVVPPSRPPSPDRRLSRPHSPAPQQERETSRRRRNSPRCYQQQAQWPTHPGGSGGWRGPPGRGGGGRYRPPVTLADLQREVSREVSRAVRQGRAAPSQSSSRQASPEPVAPRSPVHPVAPPPAVAPLPLVPAPSVPSPSVAAPATSSRLHLPPVPPVTGVEFVAAGSGAAAALYAADESLRFLAAALLPPQTRVPETTLGQLHRLAESLHALLLIQVLAHSSLPAVPPESFRSHLHDPCLDAADQLAELLAPVLAAPAEGGAAAAGQLGEAVRALRRYLHAGSGAAAIGASTLVVRELWRSLTTDAFLSPPCRPSLLTRS
ncbi:unnamed protein product [Closterium sp. NIES-54]